MILSRSRFCSCGRVLQNQSVPLFSLQSDTEFWDKMQAEWEELARRNWLEESESQQKPIPPSVSPVEKVTPMMSPHQNHFPACSLVPADRLSLS